jgi:hypothetical protein
MTEMVTSSSMSGAGNRSAGLLGEGDYERRRSLQAPPALHVTALFLDSTAGPGSADARPLGRSATYSSYRNRPLYSTVNLIVVRSMISTAWFSTVRSSGDVGSV